jgi:hypothetical protein
MAAKKRKRRTAIQMAVEGSLREARREKLDFERRLSALLGEALNLDVTVKLKPRKLSPDSAKAKRVAKKAGPYYNELEEMFDGPNGILAQRPSH